MGCEITDAINCPHILAIKYIHMLAPKQLSKRIFIASLFAIAQNWKQPKSPPTAEGIDPCICPSMDYYTVTRVNRLSVYTTMWLNLTI